MDETNPAAQDGQPGADAPEELGNDVPEGLKKRIGQLVGQREAEKQRAAQLESQLQTAIAQAQAATEMVTRLSQVQAPQPAAPAEPEVEIDPEEFKKIEYVARKLYGPQDSKLNALMRAVEQTQLMLAASEGSRKVADLGVPDPVRAEAKKLFDSMQARGYKEWSMEDSVYHILGKQSAEQLRRQAAAGAARSRMNGTHTIPFQSGAPGVGGGPSLAGEGGIDALPPNFESLPPKEKMKLLKKRGVEDKPL